MNIIIRLLKRLIRMLNNVAERELKKLPPGSPEAQKLREAQRNLQVEVAKVDELTGGQRLLGKGEDHE